MTFECVSNEPRITASAVGALLLSSLAICGCATSNSGTFAIDARAEAPASTPSVYLPVQDLPPKRAVPALTADERLKLEKELIAARDRQAAPAAQKGPVAR